MSSAASTYQSDANTYIVPVRGGFVDKLDVWAIVGIKPEQRRLRTRMLKAVILEGESDAYFASFEKLFEPYKNDNVMSKRCAKLIIKWCFGDGENDDAIKVVFVVPDTL